MLANAQLLIRFDVFTKSESAKGISASSRTKFRVLSNAVFKLLTAPKASGNDAFNPLCPRRITTKFTAAFGRASFLPRVMRMKRLSTDRTSLFDDTMLKFLVTIGRTSFVSVMALPNIKLEDFAADNARAKSARAKGFNDMLRLRFLGLSSASKAKLRIIKGRRKFLAALLADEILLGRRGDKPLSSIKFNVQVAMFLACDALQVLNLIVSLVAVDVVNLVALWDSSVVIFPNDPMKGSVRRLIPTTLIAPIIDAIKALVRVVDNLNFHNESLL